MTTKRAPHPAGRPHPVMIWLTEEEKELLKRLAFGSMMSQQEAVRLAIREAGAEVVP